MTKPISPNEITSLKKKIIPDEVIESFNELIVEKWDGKESIVRVKSIVDRIVNKIPDLDRSLIYSNKWLDIEDIYRNEGWVVIYDQPGYCETYDAYFKFSRKR